MQEEDIEFGHYGRIARRGWWVLAVGVVLGALAAVFLLPSQDTFYESRISVLLAPSESDIAQGVDAISEDTEIGIAVSQVIGDRVVTQVDGLTLSEWRENLIVSACLDSESVVLDSDGCSSRIIEFRYSGDTRAEAQELVELTAATYLEFRQDREQELISSTMVNLEAELDDLEARGDAERIALLGVDEDSIEAELIERTLRNVEDTKLTVIDQLTELRSRSTNVGSLLGDASEPEEGSSGIPFLFAVVAGALLGLMLGAVVAIGLDRLDRRISAPDELESDLGVPVLGDIPRITQDSPALVTAVSAHTPGAEAFRRVAAAALATRNGVAVNSIAIVGANENEGRTTTTINLALAMSQTGRDVLIVNTDRRNIVIDRIFGLVGEAGLNDFLRSNADRNAAHMTIDNASQRLGIRILSTGTGSEVSLSNAALQTLIEAASERDMTIVFDTPPALTHAGGLQIAAMADAVYVVAADGKTRRSELNELIAQLENVQANLAGAIFNRASRLNLLPAGHGDIATVSIPAGVPGNSKNSGTSPFQQPQNGMPVHNGAPQQNGAPVQQQSAPVAQANGAPVQQQPAPVAHPNGQAAEQVAPQYTADPATVTVPHQADIDNFSNMTGLFGTDVDGNQQ